MRNTLVVAGALVAVALCVPVALGSERTGAQVVGVAAVVALAVLVSVRHASAARLAGWFAVPALVLGWSWWRQTSWFVYSVVAGTSVGPDLSAAPAVELSGDPGLSVPLALPALVGVLWLLATVGLLTVTRRPGPSATRTLAVVAAVLTVPLWIAPAARMTTTGAAISSLAVPREVAAAQLCSLVLVLVVGAAVVATPEPRPARAATYALPALGLTWTSVQGALAYGHAGFGATGAPSLGDALPWVVVTVAQALLVGVLWVVTALGARVLFTRYRPPDVVPVSPSGR